MKEQTKEIKHFIHKKAHKEMKENLETHAHAYLDYTKENKDTAIEIKLRSNFVSLGADLNLLGEEIGPYFDSLHEKYYNSCVKQKETRLVFKTTRSAARRSLCEHM